MGWEKNEQHDKKNYVVTDKHFRFEYIIEDLGSMDARLIIFKIPIYSSPRCVPFCSIYTLVIIARGQRGQAKCGKQPMSKSRSKYVATSNALFLHCYRCSIGCKLRV